MSYNVIRIDGNHLLKLHMTFKIIKNYHSTTLKCYNFLYS